MPNNGLLYTDQRVLVSLCTLTREDRDQETCPITQRDIQAHAMVSLRTVQTCLGRLTAAGLIAAIGGSRGVSPVYVVTEEGKKIVEAYK